MTDTAVNACDVVVRLDDAGGNLVDISGESNNASIDFSREIGEFKSFGSQWKTRLACGKDASISLDVVYSQDTAEASKLIEAWFHDTDGKRTLQIDIPDSSPGGVRYEAEVVMESYSIPLAADDANPIMLSCSLLPDGEVIRSIIS